MSSAYHTSLRLTPSNSPYTPFARSPTPRSPTKSARQEEPGLHLQKVIGTTTASANAFDCLPAAGKFAFTAGAAAVLATVDDALEVTQHFFRANPSSAGRETSNGWPLSPTPGDPRNRVVGNLKDPTFATSPSNAAYGRDWSDSNRSLTAKDRVKAATSVAISPNGKWLALGETGYKPRILLFAARDGSSETPASIVAEHTFGVHALSFSPDGSRLASLGTVNDGFLYVWSVDDRTGAISLFASNKCTTLIHSISWMGRSIVTVGLRFAKVWRPEEDPTLDTRESSRSTLVTPRPKLESRHSDFGNSILSPRHRVLAGKNSLLGDLLEATFISVIPISETKALVSAESGEVCLLDDSDRLQSITLAINAGMRITSARVDDRNVFHAIGPDDQIASFRVSDLERFVAEKPSRRQSGSPSKLPLYGGTTVVAVATVGTAIVEINSDRGIRLSRLDLEASSDENVQRRRLPAHEDAVLGVQTISSSTLPRAAFFTFSGNGTVHFWDVDGIAVGGLTITIDDTPEMYGMPNELTAMAAVSDGRILAAGEKYGTVALVEVSTRSIVHQVRAHAAEILDLLAFEREGAQFLASASRDRTVQLFTCRDKKLELLQTMDEHAGAVTSLLLAQNGRQLLSCSADRTIVVRDSVFRDPKDASTLAFGMLRCITLKSAPTSMCLAAQPDSILVSTLDRCVVKYSTNSGQPGFSFKCSDNDGGEAVVMSKVLYAPSMNGNPTIAGVSSSDKSVRLYSEYGSLIARDWGHTEGITDMAIVTSRSTEAGTSESLSPRIVTVAADSTIFLWDSRVASGRVQTQASDSTNEVQTAPTTTPLGPPLRKVISHSEISRFRRERPAFEQDPPSPVANGTPTHQPSPPKIRKKSSRIALSQAPRLEPGFRSNYDATRRKSLRQRSPSPPSPRNTNKKEKDLKRRPSTGMTLRSKSSENMLSTTAANNGFGSLTGSTESLCRTLRAYRKKLTNTPTSETMAPDALREVEKELKLTAKALGERSHDKNISEAALAKLLNQATEKFAGLLNDQLKAKADGEVRRAGDSSAPSIVPLAEIDEHATFERSDTAPGALETPNVRL